jgi:hypothetical protein
MIRATHVIARVAHLCLALAVAAASMVVLAQPASAQPRVSITGKPTVGATLSAKVTGATVQSVAWMGCSTKPTGVDGRTCATRWSREGVGMKYKPTRTGLYLRVEATVRLGNGQRRTITSSAVGPVVKKGPTPTPGGGAAVGMYQCPLYPYGTTYISILPRGQYLGPYANRDSKPGNYRLVSAETEYPGGKVFDYLDGPYDDKKTWRNEYYPKGSIFGDKVAEVPTILLVVLSDSRKYRQWCYWIQADPWPAR